MSKGSHRKVIAQQAVSLSRISAPIAPSMAVFGRSRAKASWNDTKPINKLVDGKEREREKLTDLNEEPKAWTVDFQARYFLF